MKGRKKLHSPGSLTKNGTMLFRISFFQINFWPLFALFYKFRSFPKILSL